MTSQACYAMGYVYGLIAAKLPGYDHSGAEFGKAARNPVSGFAAIMAAAHRERVITPALDEAIAEAMVDVDEIDNEPNTWPEPCQPLPNQSEWMRGFYAAQGGKPYFDIAARRESAGLTQQQLAEALGVQQSVVSRWESGQVKPRPDTMARIRAAIK